MDEGNTHWARVHVRDEHDVVSTLQANQDFAHHVDFVDIHLRTSVEQAEMLGSPESILTSGATGTVCPRATALCILPPKVAASPISKGLLGLTSLL